jgi:nicotinate-nucleotide adenylyltransferase
VTGVLGGTFDPPHLGHVALARAALDHFRLERLVVIVAGRPPHKQVQSEPEIRFRLAELAFAELPRTALSRLELERDDYAYTVETARLAEREWGDVLFLVGADAFAEFPSWRDPDGILEHARLGVATRPGYSREQLDAVLRGLRRPERVEFFDMEPTPISSTDVRARVARGEPVDGLVPAPVAREIERLGLYRG